MISFITLAVILIVGSADAGVSYIRWGRTVCPAGATRLYKGYMAGPHAGVGGNGGNNLCVHDEPKFVRPIPGNQAWTARIYGVEMEYVYAANLQANGPLLNENLNGGKIHDQDMVCVACHVAGSSDKIMVPGRQDCGDFGYDVQYKGFLVAQAHVGRQRGEYLCMDESPEGRSGGSKSDEQSLVYVVEASCGSLPCAPYVEGFEMPCSMCTY